MKVMAIALVLTSIALPVFAGPVSEVGAGVILGNPIGGTAKLWFDRTYAVDLGVGYSGSTALWGDLLYHSWGILPQPAQGQLGLYFGAGPRLETADDTQFGIRTIAGMSWRLTRQPLEFFAEAGPVFRLTQGGHVDADGGVGVRLFLGAKPR